MPDRLEIAVYSDEDVDIRVAEILKAKGVRAITCRQAGMLGQSDEAQLAWATEHAMALLTHNRVDFEQLARNAIAAGTSHSGMFIAVKRPYHEIARRMSILLNQVTADEISGNILYL